MENYDPLSVLIKWTPPALAISVTGIMDGTFIEAQRDKPAWEKKIGAGGDAARAKVRNKGGTIKVTILMTSPTNQQFSLMHALGEQLPITGTDAGPFMISDLIGGTLCHAKNAWIQKMTDIKFGDAILAREWTFDVDSLDIVVGSGGPSQ